MSEPGVSESDLVAREGVDEASAEAVLEDSDTHGTDVLGEPLRGGLDSEQQPAGPLDTETPQSRQARDERGTGQQLQEGEG